MLPSDQRRKVLEKAKARAKKDRISGMSEIVVGTQVSEDFQEILTFTSGCILHTVSFHVF